ncbi:DNA-binding domain-containing protein [Paraburkholderia sp. Ac-20342]|uniref:MobH family relaxase n=1 Tax=Paraburkholderia sp. Ac-20342 TaxID=2703889 RepID=UPI00197EE70B|nr:MobH family relaxase [Paraburkholderia sp. Ac-20342]MBN3846960.1 DNA-binding domain-containing protein [Paraburkholderia sp. Ac-20342]
MFRLLKKKPAPLASTQPLPVPAGFVRPESADRLLGTQRRQMLLEHIWQRTSLSRQQFAELYQRPLERYALLVQHLPASESHHHAYPGGMLDHGLEIVAYALKLRQSRLLPVGSTPEDQAAQAEAWTAATAYAALLHDVGKIAVDIQVERVDGGTWHPWHGPMTQPYRFRYREGRAYRLHSAASALLYRQVLDTGILDWLSDHQDVWEPLLYVLAGQYEHAGALGELVVQADQASVAQALGGDPSRALAAPRHALQRKLLDGLRYLLKEEFKLNQLEASDGWLTQDALWLVSKTVSDKLRAHLLSQGIEGIPSSNTALFTILQDHGMALATVDGKAIWKATVTGENGWSHTFTFLKLAPALIWDNLGKRPPPFAGTVVPENAASETLVEPKSDGDPGMASASPTADAVDPVSDLLSMFGTPEEAAAPPSSQQLPTTLAGAIAQPVEAVEMLVTPMPHNERQSTEEAARAPATSEPLPSVVMPSGKHFIAWLRLALQTRKLVLNDAKALVHTVADTVYLVSPGIFQRYAQEYPRIAALARETQLQDWQWVQKQFEKLQIHRKQANGLNIWTCTVMGPRKSRQLHGYLLDQPSELLDELYANNPYLSVKSDAKAPGAPISDTDDARSAGN